MADQECSIRVFLAEAWLIILDGYCGAHQIVLMPFSQAMLTYLHYLQRPRDLGVYSPTICSSPDFARVL